MEWFFLGYLASCLLIVGLISTISYDPYHAHWKRVYKARRAAHKDKWIIYPPSRFSDMRPTKFLDSDGKVKDIVR